MAQYGFLFDQSRCSGCHACAVACKNWHALPPGPLKYLRIYEYEKGSFPDVRVHFLWVPCYHCEEPACVVACPCDAIYKEPRYGAVLIESEKCDGCRICYDVCPYGAPVFESDEPGVPAQKCTMCIDRLEAGEQPLCVLACPTRALQPYEIYIRRCLNYAAENHESPLVAEDVRELEIKHIKRPSLNSFIECTICQDVCRAHLRNP